MKAKVWMSDRKTTYDEVDAALIAGGFSGYSIGYNAGRFVYFGNVTATEFRRALLRLLDEGLIS